MTTEVDTLDTADDAGDEELPAEVELVDPAPEPLAARTPEPSELPQVIEALLLASQAPLSMAQLKGVTGMSADAVSGALEQLSERYREGASGVVLAEIAGGWLFRTGEAQKVFVRRLLGVKPQRLTRAALETLALVAYRQPITRPEIEDVRGVDCGAVLKALLERRLLKILGKKEEPGRPLLYGTSKEFLEVFSLKSLTALPTLREFHELTEESRSIVENETGETVPAQIEGLAELADGGFAVKLEQNAAEDAEALADLEAAMEEAAARAKKLSEQMDVVGSTMPGGDEGRALSHGESQEPSTEEASLEPPASSPGT